MEFLIQGTVWIETGKARTVFSVYTSESSADQDASVGVDSDGVNPFVGATLEAGVAPAVGMEAGDSIDHPTVLARQCGGAGDEEFAVWLDGEADLAPSTQFISIAGDGEPVLVKAHETAAGSILHEENAVAVGQADGVAAHFVREFAEDPLEHDGDIAGGKPRGAEEAHERGSGILGLDPVGRFSFVPANGAEHSEPALVEEMDGLPVELFALIRDAGTGDASAGVRVEDAKSLNATDGLLHLFHEMETTLRINAGNPEWDRVGQTAKHVGWRVVGIRLSVPGDEGAIHGTVGVDQADVFAGLAVDGVEVCQNEDASIGVFGQVGIHGGRPERAIDAAGVSIVQPTVGFEATDPDISSAG